MITKKYKFVAILIKIVFWTVKDTDHFIKWGN